jgi:hypothetical protein
MDLYRVPKKLCGISRMLFFHEISWTFNYFKEIFRAKDYIPKILFNSINTLELDKKNICLNFFL